MKVSELKFEFPEKLIALEPAPSSRVMWVDTHGPREINKDELLAAFSPGDVLVINDTKVVPRRIVLADGFDLLFLRPTLDNEWEVLFLVKKLKGNVINLPGGITGELIEKGRPHLVKMSEPLTDEYFEKYGEPPLPPYLYRARGDQKSRPEEHGWYQSDWARAAGSVAAPTASFHLKKSDLETLRTNGVHVETVTLHVGAGTFLPVTVENLDDHIMHKENVVVPHKAWERITKAKLAGRKVWVLGTTAARAVESAAHGILGEFGIENSFGEKATFYAGETGLLIKPGFDFRITDRLLTNFHQPESTLLALVCGFAGPKSVMGAYKWAIEREFRLFSYGDLSVWIR
ncbi:MAG: S-adenosylmethionine:tRNA ribosyltransferase-isomerase [Bdellovibrionia bacterium]